MMPQSDCDFSSAAKYAPALASASVGARTRSSCLRLSARRSDSARSGSSSPSSMSATCPGCDLSSMFPATHPAPKRSRIFFVDSSSSSSSAAAAAAAAALRSRASSSGSSSDAMKSSIDPSDFSSSSSDAAS